MNPFNIEIKNYRFIRLDAPLSLTIDGRVSFILGVNNTGKSSLFKFFTELKPFFQTVLNTVASISEGARIRLDWQDYELHGNYWDHIVNRGNPDKMINVVIDCGDCSLNISIGCKFPNFHTGNLKYLLEFGGSKNYKLISECLSVITDSLYIGPYRGTVFQRTDAVQGIALGTQFVAQWGTWATGTDVIKRESIKRLIFDLKELFALNELTIQLSEDKKKLMVGIDDGTFTLDELGDGLSHFIVALANAVIQKPSLILVDEPEGGLHPALQQQFIRALAVRSKFGLIAASHSVALARSSADNVYFLGIDKDKKRFLRNFDDRMSASLQSQIIELGYSQFVEIGGNNILLVEGRTDIKFYREILRKFHLDSNFIVIALGGASYLTSPQDRVRDELTEIKRINAKSVSVIFDSEREGEDCAYASKFEPFVASCVALGFQVFPTEVYATDNYLTQEALDKVFGPNRYLQLDPFENINKTNKTHCQKSDNWKVAREIPRSLVESWKLGEFIKKKLILSIS